MPFPASHRQLRVVTNFPIPLLSSTIAHLIRFPQLRSPLGLSHFPGWVSLRRAENAFASCVDQTQPPFRSLPPLRDGDESCAAEGARGSLLGSSCGEGGWQCEALPLRGACFHPWETGARVDVANCVPAFPSPMDWVMVCTLAHVGKCGRPESTAAEALAGPHHSITSSHHHSLPSSGGQHGALHFAAHPSGLTPLPLELTPCVCISLIKPYSIHPCLGFCFPDNLVKVTTTYTSGYILSHVLNLEGCLKDKSF